MNPITTDEEHKAALEEIERLWGAKLGTPDGDRLDELAMAIFEYEERRWPDESPH